MVFVVAATLALSEPSPAWPHPVMQDAQSVLNRVLGPYRDHPAGPAVYDYRVCHFFDHRYTGVLIPQEKRSVRLTAFQVWDIDTVSLHELRRNPSDDFMMAYSGLQEVTFLKRFDEIGLERCADMLDQFTMPFEEYLEWTDTNRTLGLQSDPFSSG